LLYTNSNASARYEASYSRYPQPIVFLFCSIPLGKLSQLPGAQGGISTEPAVSTAHETFADHRTHRCRKHIGCADDLPGVKPSDTIVQPLPEPIDDKPDAPDGAIKVGDWDVKVSGSIIVDVGVGNIKPPRR
jgi:hypothetical protein